ncbi:OmpH family outer membrane protein [Cyclobacterium marinum]|uniref:OmpH family outer membrane protein n=1 Tax=Cyclobacterium marinum TaxID=104 RepID=UPI0030DD4357|tara:strand:+ start:5620 stop:6126 length:507 start_codon:yes stop_codon:yes gene_type:complete
MLQFKLSFAVIGFWLLTATTIHAQSFAYVNSSEILAETPALEQAERNLEAFQKQLQEKGQVMVETFQAKVADLEDKIGKGEITPVEKQNQTELLQKEQENIGKFELEMVSTLQDKRNELIKPIYDRINEAIKLVAQEQGYNAIFDQQSLLFSEESIDVTAMVKAKLGI